MRQMLAFFFGACCLAATIALAIAAPGPAAAFGTDCKTVYETVCVQTDRDGKCTKYERRSHEVCTDPQKPAHVGEGSRECYECIEHNSDGSCKRTRKVKC